MRGVNLKKLRKIANSINADTVFTTPILELRDRYDDAVRQADVTRILSTVPLGCEIAALEKRYFFEVMEIRSGNNFDTDTFPKGRSFKDSEMTGDNLAGVPREVFEALRNEGLVPVLVYREKNASDNYHNYPYWAIVINW
jgi:hypothetical protein